jgi:hypothetical protein
MIDNKKCEPLFPITEDDWFLGCMGKPNFEGIGVEIMCLLFASQKDQKSFAS